MKTLNIQEEEKFRLWFSWIIYIIIMVFMYCVQKHESEGFFNHSSVKNMSVGLVVSQLFILHFFVLLLHLVEKNFL